MSGSNEVSRLLDCGWTMEGWSAQGGYSGTARKDDSPGKANRHKEALFFSPHCQTVGNFSR